MSKKSIIISVVSVVIVAVIAIVLLGVFSKPPASDDVSTDPATADPTRQEAITQPDLSIDLGACEVVSVDIIASHLEVDGLSVGQADNRGFGHESNGDTSQTCVYPLNSTDNLYNRLTVTVTEFANDENKNIAKIGFTSLDAVDSVGDAAYLIFTPDESSDTSGPNRYDLYVFSGDRLFTFSLLQPSDSDAFSVKSANDALIAIAASSNSL